MVVCKFCSDGGQFSPCSLVYFATQMWYGKCEQFKVCCFDSAFAERRAFITERNRGVVQDGVHERQSLCSFVCDRIHVFVVEISTSCIGLRKRSSVVAVCRLMFDFLWRSAQYFRFEFVLIHGYNVVLFFVHHRTLYHVFNYLLRSGRTYYMILRQNTRANGQSWILRYSGRRGAVRAQDRRVSHHTREPARDYLVFSLFLVARRATLTFCRNELLILSAGSFCSPRAYYIFLQVLLQCHGLSYAHFLQAVSRSNPRGESVTAQDRLLSIIDETPTPTLTWGPTTSIIAR